MDLDVVDKIDVTHGGVLDLDSGVYSIKKTLRNFVNRSHAVDSVEFILTSVEVGYNSRFAIVNINSDSG